MAKNPPSVHGARDMTIAEREIFLIGANSLLNELLAHFITASTGAVCATGADLSCVPSAVDGTSSKRLVLADFSDTRQSLEDLISSDRNDILKSDYVVLINVSNNLQIEYEALQCGVRGFFYYQGGIKALLKMIHSVLNSELWISREVMTQLLEGGLRKPVKMKEDLASLTGQEINILNAVAMGLTNADIADKFCVSPHTVKTHVYHIFKKIGVTNRLQAALWASNHN